MTTATNETAALQSVSLTPMVYGWHCEIRTPTGFLVASGFANYQYPNAKAEAVTRALAQL